MHDLGWTLVTILHVFVCLFLILVVLLQAGKGGGMGVAFGTATSSAVFGGRGAGSFLEKLTSATAIMFMATSIGLAWSLRDSCSRAALSTGPRSLASI